ncbi:hypothetical protein JP0048_05740 [Helicobacter pylori]|uniref:DASS family sodium-coupled anion symporter n=1 Tax=Helicobacter pylori TaxID=210 RepID=UPI001AA45E3C|nr:DASS family sodium-coupled anion symporter [Helicobacter pylori]GHP71431.1 hypothetical protein JP0048_05740 [Helicobacter pylori]
MTKPILSILAPFFIATLLYFLGAPDGLNPSAWLYFCIFIGMIIGLVLEPVPPGLVALSALVLCVALKIGASDEVASANKAISWGLSGYANKTVWLVFVAFILGLGYEKSLLGKRIALLLIRFLGQTPLGLGYAIGLSELCLAPFIPSNSARSGGILYPIVSSIPPLMGSAPNNNPDKKELEGMGRFSLKEILMLNLTLLALLGWILGKPLGLHASATALIVMVLMAFCKIVSYEDIIKNKSAFNIFLLLGSLLTMASGLKNVGFLNFIGNAAKNFLEHANLNPLIAVLFIIAFFYLSHYFFASITAHVSALFALFVGIGSHIQGINLQELSLFLMLSLGIMGILTPYGTGPSTIYYGSGYISSKDFWKWGFIFGVVYLIVFLSVCVPWVKFIAYRWL